MELKYIIAYQWEYTGGFFINWIPANLIPCYNRAFTLWMCIISKLYGAEYIAFISLVGPDPAFKNCA